MTLSFFPTSKKIGNIIMKDHVIRYLELKQTEPPIIQKCGERYLPEGIIRDGRIIDIETLSMIVEECMGDWGLKGKRLVRFTIPDNFVVVRKISIPTEVESDEIEGYIYLEIGSSIHLPFEDPVFDYVELPSETTEKEILLFAAPKDIVLDYVEFFKEMKLNPVAADISPLCLYRSFFYLNHVNPQDHHLLLQFDLTMINAAIIYQHRPVFIREVEMDIPFSKWEEEINSQGEKNFKWPTEEPPISFDFILKELERVMSYYRFSMNQGKAGVTKILLNGDHPLLEEIEKTLTEQLDLPVITIQSQQNSRLAYPTFHARFAPVLGLALKEVK
ncbi:type IV pilus biogenesis protein PilM [Heyndrickxia ginsengihumi]|uniref:type IV pilus biogenesis protein PilM n=1 Tax=Heyndrickxia ginsengihumi TaxID=363870 RepID=UPI003D1C5D1B